MSFIKGDILENQFNIPNDPSNDNVIGFEDDRLRSCYGNMTYVKFIKILSQIIELTNQYRKQPIKFISYASYQKSQDIQLPIITYKVARRIPNETKPRHRDTIKDENNQYITIKGQQFIYTVEFTVFAVTEDEAEEYMLDLEDIIQTYTWYFQQHGVIDLRFLEQTQDDYFSEKENFYTKTIRYNIILEKLTVISEATIKSIVANIKVD